MHACIVPHLSDLTRTLIVILNFSFLKLTSPARSRLRLTTPVPFRNFESASYYRRENVSYIVIQ